MKYEDKLIEELKNPFGHLYISENWIHSELNATADNLLDIGNNTENIFTSIFIYHQLTEDIIIHLYKFCNLIIRASIFPLKLSENSNIYGEGFKNKLSLLNSSIEFKNKNNIRKISIKINKIRNQIGHRLISDYSEIVTNNELKFIKNDFNLLFEYFQESLIWLNEEIERIKITNEKLVQLLNKK